MFPLLLANWKYVVIGILVMALGVLYLYNGKLSNNLESARNDLLACETVNKSMAETIDNLKSALDKSNQNCITRIKSKDKVINDIMKINTLEGAKNGTSKGILGDNPLTNALNTMWLPTKSDSTEGIH